MHAPSWKDRCVKVRAFLTDMDFGHDHWWAKQFLAPAEARPALLVVCETDEEQQTLQNVIRELYPEKSR